MNADSATLRDRLRVELICVLPTSLVSAATTVSFIGVFGTWDFLWPMIAMALLTHGLGAIVRAMQPPALLAAVAPIAVVYVGIGWLHFADTLRFGIPLSGTWTVLSQDVRSAWNLVGNVVTPVGFDTGFGTASILVIGFVAIATDAFASRYGGRVEVFVPAAATLFIVAAVGTGENRIPIAGAWLTTALVSAALIRSTRAHVRLGTSTRTFRRGSTRWATSVRAGIGTFVFVGIVGAAAAIIAPLLPGSTDEAWLTGQLEGRSRRLEPLVDVRRQLADTSPSLLFTVRSEVAAYWRLTALPDFDGAVWTVSERVLDSAAGELSQPIGATDPGVVPVPNLQRFSIEALAGNLVPVAATPTQLRSSTQSLFFEPDTGSLLVGSGGLRRLDSYDIQSTMLAPRPERLLVATSTSPPDESYLALPDSAAMRRLREMASSITSPANSPYQKALDLQDYFRTEFTYSLDVPPLSEADATLQFLERRSGYCEHFASTFAIFARSLGLPSRVAIGFTPGDRTEMDSGSPLYSVSSTHAHAWPEVWFDDIGWVLFEPTPGRGAPNASYTNVPEEQADESPPPSTIAPITPTTVPTNSPSPNTTAVADSSPASPATDTRNGGPLWPVILVVAIILLVTAWTVAVPRAIRSRIVRRAEPPILRLWRRAIALYELERGDLPMSLSPRELAERATSRLYDDDPFILELAERASKILFDELPATSDSTTGDDADDEVIARGHVYLRERRSRATLGLRIRLRLDPFAMWRAEGGPTRR